MQSFQKSAKQGRKGDKYTNVKNAVNISIKKERKKEKIAKF